MNTISDLRRSLEETAHSHDTPDPHELLRGVQADIATGADKGKRMPRLVAAAAAIALVAGGGWALSQGLGEDEETGTIQQADPAWELVDGAPPEYAAGLALMDTIELGAEYVEKSATTAGPGQVHAVVWCDVAPEAASTLSVALWDSSGEAPTINCRTGDGTSPSDPAALPSTESDAPLHVKLLGADGAHPGDLASDDTVTVGVYREATTTEFPYPDQQPVPDPPTHDVVLNASSPMTNQAELADLTKGGVMLPAASVESRADTTLTTWSGEPGRLLVAVNGTVITNDGEGLAQPAGAGRWQDADPDLRGGYWHTWTAGSTTRQFDLSPAGLALHGIRVNEGDTVVVTASGAFPRDAWQVGIDQPADAAPGAAPETTGPTESLPQFAYGYEQVIAVSVPADGTAHEVDLGEQDPAEVVWVAECPESMFLAEIRVGNAATQCNHGIEWLLAAQDTGLAAGETVDVSVGVGPEPVTLSAYAPREWDGYSFAESVDPLGTSEKVAMLAPPPIDGEAPPELAESQGPRALYREVARVGREDLDADGRAEITVPSSTDLSIWLETAGVARVQLKVDGTPIDQLLPTTDQPVLPGPLHAHELLVRDGWYSTWTAEPTGHELRFDHGSGITGHGVRDNPTVTIEVDAADGGDVDLVFFEFVTEEEFDG